MVDFNNNVVPFPKQKGWGVSTKTPERIAEKGQALYRERFRNEYEEQYPGKYLAIDINTEKAFIGDTPEAAVEALQKANPNGFYHLVRIGSPGVYRVGYTQHQSRRERVF